MKRSALIVVIALVCFDSPASANFHGFALSNGIYTTISAPAGPLDTELRGINDEGQIIGGYSDDSGWHSFVLDGDTFHPLSDPNADETFLTRINDAGQIVGYNQNGSGALEHGFVYSNGIFTPLNDPLAVSNTIPLGINDAGQIVGSFDTGVGSQRAGFVETAGVYTTISAPNSNFTVIDDINSKGQMIGVFEDSSNQVHYFLYQNGGFTDISDPSSNVKVSGLSAISDTGQIIGTALDGNSNVGFILDDWTFTFFNDPLAVSLTDPTDVNSAGQIVGIYNNDLPLPLPEPTDWTMMLFGFGVLGMTLRAQQSRMSRPA